MRSNGYHSQAKQRMILSRQVILVCLISVLLIFLCILASFMFGARSLSFDDIVSGIFGSSGDNYIDGIIQRRTIRTVFALCCGAALGISGALMQSVTRNPIADPSILGVNSGAALFVVAGLSFFQISTAYEYIGFALAGALVTAIFVFGVGSLGQGGATPLKLVLAGAATSAAMTSLTTAFLLPRMNVMDKFRFWQVGSVGAGTWDTFNSFLPFLIGGIVLAILAAPALNAIALGEEAAVGLGVNTTRIRLLAALAGVLLCGATTAIVGPIAFIGLLATHLTRLLLGPDLRVLIPMSAVAGAVILTISDVVGRIIGSPGELEVGVVTAFIGAPILIVIAMKAKMRSL